MFGAAALAQIATSRMVLRRQLGAGLSLLALGLIGVTVAIWHPSLALLLTGGALAGAGAGAVFRGSISTVLDIAPAYARGEALAGLFLAAYLGLAVPVLGLGLATQAFNARTSLLGFSVVLAVVIAAVARRLLARPARPLGAGRRSTGGSVLDDHRPRAEAAGPAGSCWAGCRTGAGRLDLARRLRPAGELAASHPGHRRQPE